MNLPGIHPCPLITLIRYYFLFANASAYALALDISAPKSIPSREDFLPRITWICGYS